MKKLIIDKVIDEFTDLKFVYPKIKTIDVINLLQVIKQEQDDKFYSEEEARIIWRAGQEYSKTSGDSITFEELTEKFKNK